MNQANSDFSTQKITPQLISHIVDALRNKSYGSIEIYVENYSVVQITERKITKLARSNSGRNISVTFRRPHLGPRPNSQRISSGNRE